MCPRNLLQTPHDLAQPEETFESLLETRAFRLEHIASRGCSTPPGEWYNQKHPEWVLLLQGTAELTFADGESTQLRPGDHLHIPAHRKHRVASVSHDALWVALHYKET